MQFGIELCKKKGGLNGSISRKLHVKEVRRLGLGLVSIVSARFSFLRSKSCIIISLYEYHRLVY